MMYVIMPYVFLLLLFPLIETNSNFSSDFNSEAQFQSDNEFKQIEQFSLNKCIDEYDSRLKGTIDIDAISIINRASRICNKSPLKMDYKSRTGPEKSISLKNVVDANLLDAKTDIRINKRESDYYYDTNETSINDTDFEHNDTVSMEEYLEQIREFIFPKTWTWVLIFFHSAVFVIGLVGNTLVCVAVYRNHTMRTVTNYFIVNLAVADFLVILLCLPPSVIWDVTMTWFLGVALCKIVLYLQTVSVTVSVLTLTFISIDRWYAICFPLKFKSTTGRAKTAIGIIWMLGLMFDIPELVVYRTVPFEEITIYFTQCEPSWSIEKDRIWIVLKMILLYAVPLIFMTIAYCQIIRVLWKSGNVHQHSLDVSGGRHVNTFTMNTNTSTEGQLRSRRKAAKMLVCVVIMFAVCYFPVHLLNVLRVTISISNSETNRAFFLISHWLCYANSAVNPIIYNFMSGKFRKEFRRAFDHCCQSSANSQRSRYQMSNMYPKNTDSAVGSRTQTRCSKRTSTEMRRVDNGDKGFNDIEQKDRNQSEKTVVSKVDM